MGPLDIHIGWGLSFSLTPPLGISRSRRRSTVQCVCCAILYDRIGVVIGVGGCGCPVGPFVLPPNELPATHYKISCLYILTRKSSFLCDPGVEAQHTYVLCAGYLRGVSGVLKVRNTGSEKVCIVILRGKRRRIWFTSAWAYLSLNLWRDIAYEKGWRKTLKIQGKASSTTLEAHLFLCCLVLLPLRPFLQLRQSRLQYLRNPRKDMLFSDDRKEKPNQCRAHQQKLEAGRHFGKLH